MNLWRNSTRVVFGWLTPEQRTIYGLQLLLLFALSTLLYIGFPGTREWRRIAEETQIYTIIRGWDGLAWYVWLAAAPVMLMLIRRYPFTGARVGPNLLRIIVGSVLLYLLVAHARYFFRVLPDLWRGPDRELLLLTKEAYAYNTFGLLPLDFLTYCGFFAVSFSINYYFQHRQDARRAVQLQLRTAQLQSDLARAELAALRGQLQPHFLFNSFNALATLVRQQKNDAAVEIIAKLSALLRLAIDRAGLQEIALEHELDFIRRYLEIEHLRFGDKLRVEYTFEQDTLNALVPNIVLQPLVENAIKHGISLRTAPGVVRMVTARAGRRLHIEIVNDGPEQVPVNLRSAKSGIGLANARAQLDKLYGADYQLEMVKHPEGGTTVKLDLPWRTAQTAGASA